MSYCLLLAMGDYQQPLKPKSPRLSEPMSISMNPTPYKVANLHFDRENPRLAEYDIKPTTSEPEILKILWDAMDVQELVQSIAASGFFPHEPLIVAEEKGKSVIIEGNRRLAALKVLTTPTIIKDYGWELPKISEVARKKLEEVPAIQSDRKESWRYLGFKHVNGPAKWTSYAKASYIAEVYREYKVPLADIAQQIGDRHDTVQRLYRGFSVLEQAEAAKVYNREDRYGPRIYFSHLYTGLDYEGIATFLKLAPKEKETDTPVPKERLKELGELCVWLFGNKKAKQPPVVVTQNPHLRMLNAVVSNRESLGALRAGVELEKAFEISRPPSDVFEEALLAAKRELSTARAYLTTGYENSEELLRIAGTVAEMADEIYKDMERKRSPEIKKIRLTER